MPPEPLTAWTRYADLTPALRGYRCCECKVVTHLSDLNDEMVCSVCCEPELDDEDCEPAASDWAAMRSEYGTWGI